MRKKTLRVAILATNGFEPTELFEPKTVFEKANTVLEKPSTDVSVVSLKSGEIESWSEDGWGDIVAVDLTLDEANADDFDMLLMPGGVMNRDKLNMREKALAFVSDFLSNGNPVGAMCYSPWMLIKADVIRGRTITSWELLKAELESGNAELFERENDLLNGISADEFPLFNEEVLEGLFGMENSPIEMT